MTPDIVGGCIVLFLALGALTYLIVWSRRTINRIAERDVDSAREILRELRGDRHGR